MTYAGLRAAIRHAEANEKVAATSPRCGHTRRTGRAAVKVDTSEQAVGADPGSTSLRLDVHVDYSCRHPY